MSQITYSASAVKQSFWFMEFKKVVSLRLKGLDWDDIKKKNEDENIFGTKTPLRANQIWGTVSARMKCLDDSFYTIFDQSDLATQKLFVLTAIMKYDRLFGEFVYEVIREKIIIGNKDLVDSDVRVFFKNKQEQDANAANWTDETLTRLGRSYKTMLFEAGVLGQGTSTREILRPLLDKTMEKWLKDQKMNFYLKALKGVR